MNVLTLLFELPLLPVKGFVKLGEVIRDEAEREQANPGTIRHELEQVERARESGEISDEQVAEYENEAFAEFARARRDTAIIAGDAVQGDGG